MQALCFGVSLSAGHMNASYELLLRFRVYGRIEEREPRSKNEEAACTVILFSGVSFQECSGFSVQCSAPPLAAAAQFD
ncbi:MAG: hypothetical protein ACQEUB_06025, partial [Thermodesulfobacteriota bacterium]